jgi:3-oxoacyl-[acyl-carrier-protein] synthase-3
MAGIGAYVPESVITNDDLTKLVETSDEWISTRTGIRERHVVSGNETVADLAIEAAREALKSAGKAPEEIDLIIVATSTPDTIYPAVSCQVQEALGIGNAAGFDMALACSGFVYATITAYQFLKTGAAKNALVIGADIHSRFTNWEDRNTCIIFGDGAGAAVYSGIPDEEDSILGFDMHIDGSKGKELTLFVESENCPLVEKRDQPEKYLYMNGREMFKFAVGVVPKSIRAVTDAAGIAIDDIDHLVLHQANIRIMQAMSDKLNIPQEKMVANIDRIGNTSAASIPIALNEAVLNGEVKPGELLLLCGFGAGVAWGSTILRWTCVDQRLNQSAEAEKALVN